MWLAAESQPKTNRKPKRKTINNMETWGPPWGLVRPGRREVFLSGNSKDSLYTSLVDKVEHFLEGAYITRFEYGSCSLFPP